MVPRTSKVGTEMSPVSLKITFLYFKNKRKCGFGTTEFDMTDIFAWTVPLKQISDIKPVPFSFSVLPSNEFTNHHTFKLHNTFWMNNVLISVVLSQWYNSHNSPSIGLHLNDWAILFQASVTWVFFRGKCGRTEKKKHFAWKTDHHHIRPFLRHSELFCAILCWGAFNS